MTVLAVDLDAAVVTEINDCLAAMWDAHEVGPCEIYVGTGSYMRVARSAMRKRQFRRWRGRFRAWVRAQEVDR